MFTIYIAKATANFGLPATRPIYECALEGSFYPLAIEQNSPLTSFQCFQIVKRPKYVFVSRHWSENSGKSIGLVQSMPTLHSSVIFESTLLSGANGTLSRSRQDQRTPSEKCCGSNGVCLFSNYDEAIRVMQRATAIPKNLKINYHDHVSDLLFFQKSIAETDLNLDFFRTSSLIQIIKTLVILCRPGRRARDER